jgi:hypothetical protein
MSIFKKWWFWVIIVILIVLFFPKDAGKTGDRAMQPGVSSWTTKECSCIGFKYDSSPRLMDASHQIMCAGIPISCQCFHNTYDSGEWDKQPMPCGK